jgi:uroporphyrin-3 C-methyltransferase
MSDKDKKIEPKDDSSQGASTETRDTDKNDSTVEKSAADSVFDESPERDDDMTRDTTQDASLDQANDSGDDNGSKPPKNSKSSSGAKPIKWFILIIILAAIAYAIYFGWQKWQDFQANQQKADRIDQIEQQLNTQQKSISSTLSSQKQTIRDLSNQLEENRRHVSQLQDQLRTTQRKFQAQNSDKQNEWLFNEAEYLIKEASYKLNFTDDAATIIALLQAADAQLAELNDGSLTQLRQAISSDINRVRGSGNLDIEGIAIAIQTLKGNVSQLELASVQLNSKESKEQTTTQETDISSWQHFKNSVSKAASKYYTVHQFDESTQPFISPQKDRLLRENILLNLQTAQLAALQNNQSLYQSNLQDVKNWVEQYFKQKPASTSAFLQQLDELLNNSVELELPAQLNSYQLISEISQQKVNRWLKSNSDQTNREQPDSEETSSEKTSSEKTNPEKTDAEETDSNTEESQPTEEESSE